MNDSNSIFFYSLLSALIIIYTAYSIIKNKIERRKRKDALIMQLLSKSSIVWLFYMFLLILWGRLFVKDIFFMYRILNGEYIDSIFQLFNLKYINSLSNHFYENGKTFEYINTISYTRDFMNNLYWIIFSSCLFIVNFYMGKIKSAFYEDGVFVKDKFYKKDDFLGYEWGGAYENTVFFKGVYCNLVLKLPKFFDIDRELALRINYSDKDKIDDILKYKYNLVCKNEKGEYDRNLRQN